MKDWNNVNFDSIPIRQKINGFFQYYDQFKSIYNYKDECILNLDETPVYFENHHKRTIDLMSVRKARVKVVGNIRSRVTGVLMVHSYGKLYDPCIIQQGDGLKYNQDASFGRYVLGGLNIWKQKNNTMTGDIMVDLIYKYIDPLFNRDDRKLLVMDSFSGHLTSNVKDALRECNIDLYVIPGGCTKYLQPLDISVNRSFKSRLKDAYQLEFINVGGSNGDYGTTTNGHTITSNRQSTTTHLTHHKQSTTTSTTKLKMTRLVE